MFRHLFHPRPFTPAWEGAIADDASPVRHRFRHGKHSGGQRFGGGWGEEHRTRRGDIKFILLELLSEQPRHGYDLIKELESRHGGFRRLSPGSVYPTLQMLEDGGYLTSQQESGKRIYTITDSGRELLAERPQHSPTGSPLEAVGVFKAKPQDFIELRSAAADLAEVVMQVARSGNTDRMKQVRDLLDQTKRQIYAILAEK